MAEKTNPIRFEYEDGREYVLEFSTATVREAEEGGFNINEVGNKPATQVPLLFYYAFKLHHPDITQEETDSILYNDLGGLSDDLQKRLVSLYIGHITILANKSGKPKNAKMRVI